MNLHLRLKVDGNILVVYNMGTTDHPIGELFHKVNDGKYHVIRFTREGPNATIQVDNLPMRRKNPTGQSNRFFLFSYAQMGCKIVNIMNTSHTKSNQHSRHIFHGEFPS
jgi:hypothetical protein